MEISKKLIDVLQNRLKVGNRKGVHLNAVTGNSRYKFDLSKLTNLNDSIPSDFIQALLSENPLKFSISFNNLNKKLNDLFEDNQGHIVKIGRSFENLINQTDAIESEKGINTFGFGFPLLIRRDQSDNKLTVAPLLIWNLRVKHSSGPNTWEITRNEDDAIYINEVLINHLESDIKISIDQLSNEILEDGIISFDELANVCSNILNKIYPKKEGLKEFIKENLLEIKPIPDKPTLEKRTSEAGFHPILYGGLFSIFEVQKQNIINEFDTLKDVKGLKINFDELEDHYFQPISSVETDPTQQKILHSLQTDRNIVIQGPPGTGKSQTLTSILINALENDKKTIVVCEKRTALEVLEEALNIRGLGTNLILIKDIVSDRKRVVDSVRFRIDDSQYKSYKYKYSKDTLNDLLGELKNAINNINAGHKKLNNKILENKKWNDVVGLFLSSLKNSENTENLNIDSSEFNYSRDELNRILNTIEKGVNIFSKFKDYQGQILNPQKFIGENPFNIENNLNDCFKQYFKQLEEIKYDLLSFNKEYIAKRKSILNYNISEIKNHLYRLNEIQSEYSEMSDFYNEKKTQGFVFKISSIFSSEKKNILIKQQELKINLIKIAEIFNTNLDFKDIELSRDLKQNCFLIDTFNSLIDKALSDFELRIKVELSEILLSDLEENIFNLISSKSVKEKLNNLLFRIISDFWIETENNISISEIIESITSLISAKNIEYDKNQDRFINEFNWYNFQASLNGIDKIIIENFVLNKISAWTPTFLNYYLNNLLLNYASTELPLSELHHTEYSNKFKNLESEQIKFIKQFWYSKQIDAARTFDSKNYNLSVSNLFNKRGSLNHKRLSLRKIIKHDIDFFTTFFPIILTTPDVCSNLFKGNNEYFDIILFDEASQLKLEDTLPSLLKGKQIIISGDEHQMPPSNYFGKMMEGGTEEDEFEDEIPILNNTNDILDCESLLDAAEFLKFESRFLEFHYRSKHPFLIDFSNYAFYNKRLKPLPNTFEYIPIKFYQVNGNYFDRVNNDEAETVLEIIQKNVNRLPNGNYPSVGVATLNISQRNLIKRKILERQSFSQYTEFNDKIRELEQNGFFVKNLENIQGDERDIIILSTTFGPSQEGKFAQRFGPLAHSKGYRLLNVIITRAKYKIFVCSSIPEEVFMNYKEHLVTEGSNNRKAVLYAYLAYCKAVSDANNEQRRMVLSALEANSNQQIQGNEFIDLLESPFEEEVYQALLDNNIDPNKIIPQLEYAGFRIDMVYDSKIPGIPKVAIECDGKEYHSSQEAYLNDVFREKILEEHGFVFHRIWSTNWWRNPTREIEILLAFLKEVEEGQKHTNSVITDFNKSFKDELIQISNSRSFNKYNQDDNEGFNEIVEDEIFMFKNNQEEDYETIVKLGCIIQIKFLNIDKNITIKITDDEQKEKTSENGIQKVNKKSPVALALMNHKKGDIVKIGDSDNFVEIINIE